MGIFKALGTSTDAAASAILNDALVLAAIATIVMALLEAVKALPWLAVRAKFHRGQVLGWMGRSAFSDLIGLTIGGVTDENALFDQPTNKVMAQLQAASNVALDFPNDYAALYDFLTKTSKAEGIQSDSARWKNFAAGLPKPAEELAGSPEAMAAAQARSRLDHLVARRLDAFQTRTEYRWARGNQYVAFVLTVIFIAYLAGGVARGNIGMELVLCFLGGVLAPVAKDIAVALTGLRTKAT